MNYKILTTREESIAEKLEIQHIQCIKNGIICVLLALWPSYYLLCWKGNLWTFNLTLWLRSNLQGMRSEKQGQNNKRKGVLEKHKRKKLDYLS